MRNTTCALIILIAGMVATGCAKKTMPSANTTSNPSANTPSKLPPVSAKDYAKEAAKKAQADNKPPTVIVVNDKSAKQTATGKYYYEVNGFRYWKSDKDGKYYLDGTKQP